MTVRGHSSARAGVHCGWHLGWEDLSRLTPRLVMARVTAFGVLTALRHRDATGDGQWVDYISCACYLAIKPLQMAL